MAGTIVVDRLESDASYTSSINIASPVIVANTLTMAANSKISGDFTLGTTRSANTSARIEVSGSSAGVGLLIRQTSNTSYAGLRLYNDMDTPYRALEIDYSSSAYPGPLSSGVPSGEAGLISVVGAYPLALATNNTARLVIDANGRITKPYQPMFQAWRGTSFVQNSGTGSQTIIYNNTQINVGSHYDTSTGRFTAPVAGKYQFAFGGNFMLYGDSYIYLQFRKNGTAFAYAYDNGNGASNWVHMSATVIVDLAANDYVDMWMISGKMDFWGSAGSFFNGYLLA